MSVLPVRRLCPQLLSAALAVALLPAIAGAQTAVVDEGTFAVTQNGAPLGRESFRIVRAPGPGGQVFRATGQSALGERRTTTNLATDAAGLPVAYESELQEGGVRVHRFNGRGRPGRFSVLVETRGSEAARDYLLKNGAILLESDVVHQLYFATLAGRANGDLNVIAPGAGQHRMKLEDRGAASVTVAGRAIAGRHFVLTGQAGDRREIWTDGSGRLLKVMLPGGIVAERDDPPR